MSISNHHEVSPYRAMQALLHWKTQRRPTSVFRQSRGRYLPPCNSRRA